MELSLRSRGGRAPTHIERGQPAGCLLLVRLGTSARQLAEGLPSRKWECELAAVASLLLLVRRVPLPCRVPGRPAAPSM
eukprot:scaffold570_cov382-Prasinococcus_capsulatus_cf.AAC.13